MPHVVSTMLAIRHLLGHFTFCMLDVSTFIRKIACMPVNGYGIHYALLSVMATFRTGDYITHHFPHGEYQPSSVIAYVPQAFMQLPFPRRYVHVVVSWDACT